MGFFLWEAFQTALLRNTSTEFDRAQLSFMDTRLINKKPASFGRFALIIMLVGIAFFGSVHSLKSEDISTEAKVAKNNSSTEVIVDGLTQAQRAAQIDNFFAARKSPLVGYGMKIVQEIDKYPHLDWRLTVGILTIETDAGKQVCKNPKGAYNLFGFGSCNIAFKSFDESIEVVTRHLAGEMPTTSKYYAGKTTEQILETYNPSHIRPDYIKLVKYVMNKVSQQSTVHVNPHLALK